MTKKTTIHCPKWLWKHSNCILYEFVRNSKQKSFLLLHEQIFKKKDIYRSSYILIYDPFFDITLNSTLLSTELVSPCIVSAVISYEDTSTASTTPSQFDDLFTVFAKLFSCLLQYIALFQAFIHYYNIICIIHYMHKNYAYNVEWPL